MEPRIDNPGLTTPGAMSALQATLGRDAAGGRCAGDPPARGAARSQINGCSVCVDMHLRELKAEGESEARILTVAAWRETPYFTDAERAALALTEAATRLADRPDPVPDEVWQEAAHHYDERQRGALVLSIAAINAWNRVNAATRQVAGDWIHGWIPGGGAVEAA